MRKNGFHKEHLKLTMGTHKAGSAGWWVSRWRREPCTKFPVPVHSLLHAGANYFLIEFLETSWGLYFLQVWDNPSVFLLLLPSCGPGGQTCKCFPQIAAECDGSEAAFSPWDVWFPYPSPLPQPVLVPNCGFTNPCLARNTVIALKLLIPNLIFNWKFQKCNKPKMLFKINFKKCKP